MPKQQRPLTKGRKHTKTEYLDFGPPKTHLIPPLLQWYAENFLSVAKIIPAVPDDGFHPAQMFLIGRSLELAFKAFLSLQGVPYDQMADGALGHNLDHLLTDAKNKGLDGLVKFSAEQESEIIRASVYYAEKVYEYPAVSEFVTAHPSRAKSKPLVAAAERIIDALREPCYKAQLTKQG
jgi:hypothetical protein